MKNEKANRFLSRAPSGKRQEILGKYPVVYKSFECSLVDIQPIIYRFERKRTENRTRNVFQRGSLKLKKQNHVSNKKKMFRKNYYAEKNV